MSLHQTAILSSQKTSKPLSWLEEYISQRHTLIEAWLHQQWLKHPPPIYASVDLRNDGFKLAPIDTNLFPAGFNNLSAEQLSLAAQAIKTVLGQLMPTGREVLLIPESHTRNYFYLENLATLHAILLQAECTVRIGSLLETIEDFQEWVLASDRCVVLERVRREGHQIGVGNFWPNLIVLNNDLSNGIPPILQGITQPILPALALGWHQRLKSGHFRQYDSVCQTFATLLNIDPWLIKPLFYHCQEVDFKRHLGTDCMIAQSDRLLAAIATKYRHYNIQKKPYVVIKADAGTYGRGIISIDDPIAIRQLNRKQRNEMTNTKGNRPIQQVILQEGITTCETCDGDVAEPVVYMIGQHVIGGFYRIHSECGTDDNLNTPGMRFEPWPGVIDCHQPESRLATASLHSKRFYVYGVIARLALLAAAKEQQTTSEQLSQ